jgi:hypothetical protein
MNAVIDRQNFPKVNAPEGTEVRPCDGVYPSRIQERL